MDLKTLSAAVQQIAAEKGIEPEKVLGAIESAIAAAYKKEYRKKSEVIRAKFDLDSGKMIFTQVKTVVLPENVRIVEVDSETNTLVISGAIPGRSGTLVEIREINQNAKSKNQDEKAK